MLEKTRGIVMHTTDYSESSVVVKIFTEAFGMQSYLVNSVRKPKAKTKAGWFQPLSLVDLVVYYKPNGGLQRISEIRNTPPYRSIPFDVTKTSMVIFLNEVLFRAIREEEAQPALFEFLHSALQLMDLHAELPPGFHLLFMLRLSRFLGFYPNGQYQDDTTVFDLIDGTFRSSIPGHAHFITAPWSQRLDAWVKGCDELFIDIPSSHEERRELLERILEYYRLHLTGFGEVRAHKVLQEVWS